MLLEDLGRCVSIYAANAMMMCHATHILGCVQTACSVAVMTALLLVTKVIRVSVVIHFFSLFSVSVNTKILKLILKNAGMLDFSVANGEAYGGLKQLCFSSF